MDLFSVADKQDLILKVGTSSNLILAVEVNSTEVDKSNGREFMTWKKKKIARRPKGSSYTKTVTLNSLFDFLPNTPGPLTDDHTYRVIKRAYRNPYPSDSGRYITRNANVFEFQGHQLCLDGLTYKTMTEEHNEFAIHSLGQVFNVLQNWTNLREEIRRIRYWEPFHDVARRWVNGRSIVRKNFWQSR